MTDNIHFAFLLTNWCELGYQNRYISLQNEGKMWNLYRKKVPTCEDKCKIFKFPKVFGKVKNGQKKCPNFIFAK